jgi:hypothetical protein
MASKNIAGKIGIGVFIIAILFFGLKGCVVTIWSSPKTPEIYSIQGQDNRVMSMIFLPKHHETMMWHFDPANDSAEGVLTKMRGSYGTHYIWRLWHIDGPGITFGYRIYPPDKKPVNMEITVLERYMSGKGNPSFPDKGDRSHQVLLFGKDVVKFQNMWLRKEPNNPEMIQALLSKLGGSKEK